MLTRVEVQSSTASLTEILNLSIDEATTDAIRLLNIEGLGPVKADINTTPFGSFDGEQFNGASVGKRNIVLTLGLNPNWEDQSMASLRAILYQYFMPKLGVFMSFVSTHLPRVGILGYVESFEPNMFSKDPEIQISLLCPQPNFVAADPVVVTGTVGIAPVTATEIDYEGTVETGFLLVVSPSGGNPSYTGNVAIRNVCRSNDLFQVTATIDADSQLHLSTVQGEKYVRAMDGEVFLSNLLPYTSVELVWMPLYPGTNDFSVASAETGQTWELTYTPQYGGI